MAMPVDASDIAVGDWSPTYGAVTEVQENKNIAGEVISYNFTFFNGSKLTNIKPDAELEIVQGGSDIIHNGMPDPSQIRPGLKADHADE